MFYNALTFQVVFFRTLLRCSRNLSSKGLLAIKISPQVKVNPVCGQTPYSV